MTADHKVLQNEEANIIAGALQLANKRVEDIMTKMEDVFMLDINTILDFETMAEILNYGYTRVPVYDGNSHMAIVQRLHNDGDHDPYYENLGVVTLEDVIEEIIQSEIIDETDIMTDNRRKKPRNREKLDYNVFEQKQEHGPRISQQVAFAAFQYLSTAVEPFKEQYVTRNVLKQLIRQNIVITLSPSTEDEERNYIYKKDKECDYFVLIVEGHVEVEIGKESMTFESGPFSYFGVECLDSLRDLKMEDIRDIKDLRNLPPYTPDFSVKALTAIQFLRIRRVHYLAAKRTTYMMTSTAADSDHDHQEAFHKEWHRAVAGKECLSRNSSGVGMSEVSGERKPTKDKLLKTSLLQSTTPVHPITTKADLEDHSADGRLSKASKDKSKLSTPLKGSASADASGSAENVTASETPAGDKEDAKPTKDAGDVPAVEIHDGRTFNDSSSLLPKQKAGGGTKRALAEVGSSPEDGGELEKVVVEDKVPLMGGKDSWTASDKVWVEEEEEETAPLVGPEKNASVKDGKLLKS
nr:hypothetical protein BaRGS_013566 [Batillaria attramentaria]